MPLFDHFHPPLSVTRQWHSFHHAWCTYIAANLNRLLPDDFRAEPHVQYGIEVDVAAIDVKVQGVGAQTLREITTAPYLVTPIDQQNSYRAQTVWKPPPPTRIIPFNLLTESVEVLIYSGLTIPSLVGAVELVSESNKDRPAEQQAFVSKCEAYLRQGVGVVIVDIVTSRHANLHQELLARLGAPQNAAVDKQLYTSAYRPMKRVLGKQEPEIVLGVWQETLLLGQRLPTMPLWLRPEFCAPLDLEATYEETCLALKISKKLRMT